MLCRLCLPKLKLRLLELQRSVLTHNSVSDLLVVFCGIVIFIESFENFIEAHLGASSRALRRRRLFA